jgi:hypothetical protein
LRTVDDCTSNANVIVCASFFDFATDVSSDKCLSGAGLAQEECALPGATCDRRFESPSNGFDLVVSTDDFVVVRDVVDTEQIFIGKNRIFLVEDRKRIIARLGARVGNGPVFSSIIAECIRLLLA